MMKIASDFEDSSPMDVVHSLADWISTLGSRYGHQTGPIVVVAVVISLYFLTRLGGDVGK